jgi:membrane-bound transcription factor site-1 protease
LNNPADMPNVIGVGSIDDNDLISKFSSRGVTTKELTTGYGIVKPDLVTYGSKIIGISKNNEGTTSLSGTSVSCPIVTGLVALVK